jgi:glycosyltransferase involved in cell wall biosynthesis
MERGVPVVVTDVGGMGSLVRSSGGGVVVKVGDPAGIARATATIVADPTLRRRMGDAARRAIVEAHDRASVSTALADVYRAAAFRDRESDGRA